MTGAEYIVKELVKLGVTDVFGVPGGVILKLLYAFDKEELITAHLNYHEQMSAYAALGYSFSSGNIGVCYVTRGPGVSNIFTTLVEAYNESVAILFITAHKNNEEGYRRCCCNQEINYVDSFSKYTKFSHRINNISDLINFFSYSCELATHGRRGPVFLDIDVSVFDGIIEHIKEEEIYINNNYDLVKAKSLILEQMNLAQRPVFLVGDGIRHTNCVDVVMNFCSKNNIPILSSRGAQDIFSQSSNYFGYIGSHGVRYGNFILSKCDLILSFGNRMSFPLKSKSYSKFMNDKKLIRFEIDNREFENKIPNTMDCLVDLNFMKYVLKDLNITPKYKWLSLCHNIKESLLYYDCSTPVSQIMEIMKFDGYGVAVCDVGNNEYWVSRAFEQVKPSCSLLISKSFGALGVSLGKSIGVYYASKKPVINFIGDQGFQFNIQELNFISKHNIPITIVLVNNNSSGMINDKEKTSYGYSVHTTDESGYYTPDFKKVVEAYNLPYYLYSEGVLEVIDKNKPCVIELKVDSSIAMIPILPKGNPIHEQFPNCDVEIYKKIDGFEL